MSIKTVFALVVITTCLLQLEAMDNGIFKLTGKEKYSEGWRIPNQQNSDPLVAGWQSFFNYACNAKTAQFNCGVRTGLTMDDVIQALGDNINNPVYAEIVERKVTYYYPIEETIRYGTNSTFLFAALLHAGVPVDGYRDYNPLKHILIELTKPKTRTKKPMLVAFVTILIKQGVNLDLPFPHHIGHGPDISIYANLTARNFLNDTKDMWSPDLWKEIKQLFDNAPVRAPESKSTPEKDTIASKATPEIKVQPTPALPLPNSALSTVNSDTSPTPPTLPTNQHTPTVQTYIKTPASRLYPLAFIGLIAASGIYYYWSSDKKEKIADDGVQKQETVESESLTSVR